MTLALTANLIFDATIVAVIVGMLAWAIHASRHEQPVRTAKRRVAKEHVPSVARERGARARAAGGFIRSQA